jgi:hypothetical protein
MCTTLKIRRQCFSDAESPSWLPHSSPIMDSFPRPLSRDGNTVTCIHPIGFELTTMEAMLDKIYERIPSCHGQNSYTLGRVGMHDTVLAVMPEIGNNQVALVATQLLNGFPSIRFGLLVGIGDGIPRKDEDDTRLGDVWRRRPG